MYKQYSEAHKRNKVVQFRRHREYRAISVDLNTSPCSCLHVGSLKRSGEGGMVEKRA